jgi:hypothetical protein
LFGKVGPLGYNNLNISIIYLHICIKCGNDCTTINIDRDTENWEHLSGVRIDFCHVRQAFESRGIIEIGGATQNKFLIWCF